MIDIIILIVALSAVAVVFIYASILVWLFVQELEDDY